MKPIQVDADAVVNETVAQLGQQLGRASLQSAMDRATIAALTARVEELEAAADATEGDSEDPAG